MFCRKCGEKLNPDAKFCDHCGEQVVLLEQQSDNEEIELETKKEDEVSANLKNPYVLPAFYTALVAFTLGMFPYPHSWGIGTSLPMRIIILLIALLSSYHCRKARQVNRMYQLQNLERVRPGLTKAATVISTITAMVALFTLFV